LLATKRASEAIACGEKALSINPNSAGAHTLLGMCLAALGDVDGAIARFDKALAIKPDCYEAIVTKIFVLDFSADADFEQHRDVRRLWWEHIGSPIPISNEPFRNILDPRRRLIVGYVSSDFRDHSAANAFRPVLQYMDKSRFETVCYSCSPASDSVTAEFRRIADRWHDASQWSDDRLEQQIREDVIDILVDLSGHTDGTRLRVIARKPAPVVVHGWGHATPPGLPQIDYVFSDPVTIPPEVRHLYQEKIYDLPCMLTLDRLPADVPHATLPALANGFITFGVFNRISKISDLAIEAWAQVLARVAGSKLLIKDTSLNDPLIRENLTARLLRCGIAADRIELRGGTPRLQHLAAFNNVDICLDPFPQNGGVSTWEALRMSVPVVAKLGNALPKRISAAVLSSVGLSDWVGESTEGYIDIAVAWAGCIDDLARLRQELPERLAGSAAGNPESYADAVGQGYWKMWQAYCARQRNELPG
jgi:predicted O-linked N-acetylglucosamine transferase (SPINDLY family)